MPILPRTTLPWRALVATVLGSVLALGLVPAVPAAATPGPAPAAASAPGWTPRPGVRTSNPLGGFAERRAVLRQVLRSIDHTPRGARIRVASWNLRSNDVVDALVRAHRRKVGVRVVVDRGNANPYNPNDGVRRLKYQLKRHGNAQRRPVLRSSVRKCRGACRGELGIAHAKFYLFSRVGQARHVVINTSANATDLAASHQWNDAYTLVGRTRIYRAFVDVFEQMRRQHRPRQAFRSRRAGKVQALFFPYSGKRTASDPTLKDLEKVRCRGARNTSSGRTRIRVAMTSWHGDRGKEIAWKLRRLRTRGCDVRIIYAVAGNEVLRVLRREGPRPVPMRQVVQDFDGDGVYDRYLHTKVLTIKGRYAGNRRANVVVNGSGNWTPVALASDEALLRIRSGRVVRRYTRFVDRLYRNPPTSVPTIGRRPVGFDPYAKIEVH